MLHKSDYEPNAKKEALETPSMQNGVKASSLQESAIMYDFISNIDIILETETEQDSILHKYCRQGLQLLQSLDTYARGSKAPTNELSALPVDIMRDVLAQEQTLANREPMEKMCKLDGPWGDEARSFQPLVCLVERNNVIFNRYTANHNGWTCRKQTEKRMQMTMNKNDNKEKRISETLINWPTPSTAAKVAEHAPNMTDYLFIAGDHDVVPILPNLKGPFTDVILHLADNGLSDDECDEIERFIIHTLNSKHLRKLYLNFDDFSEERADDVDKAFCNFLCKPTFEWLDMPKNCLEPWVVMEVCEAWRRRKVFEVVSQDIRTNVRNCPDLNNWVKNDFKLITGEDMVLWEHEETHPYNPEQIMRVVILVTGENPREVEVSVVFVRQREVYEFDAKKQWWDYYKSQLGAENSKHLNLMY
uniref:DUF4470 domain-containing protein n=1 Tax=Steinernema glaseri TaxID=37863 RepID=A0A1I7YXH6_9BILA